MLKRLLGLFKRDDEYDTDENSFELGGQLYESTEEEFDYDYMYYMH